MVLPFLMHLWGIIFDFVKWERKEREEKGRERREERRRSKSIQLRISNLSHSSSTSELSSKSCVAKMHSVSTNILSNALHV